MLLRAEPAGGAEVSASRVRIVQSAGFEEMIHG
jgi:hypothetical protein